MLYKAFISYSHAADDNLAPALHSALHRFAKPWYRLRPIRIFRDKTTLSVTPGLWPSIEAALKQSEYFILLASPQAAKSLWVQQEVTYWLQNAAIDRLIVIQTGDGSGSEDMPDLPPELRNVFEAQSNFFDLRWAMSKENLSLRNPRFRNLVAELAAILHSRPYEEIVAEDTFQRNRTRLLIRSAITSLLLLTLGAGISAFYAIYQRNEALYHLGDSLMANASRANINQDWLNARKIAFEAKSVFTSQRRHTFPAELAIMQSYLRAPPPLFTFHSPSPKLTFAPDRSHGLAVSGKTARLVDLKTMRVLGKYIETAHEITSVWFSATGAQALLEHPDHTLTVWYRDDSHPPLILSGIAGTVDDAAISADGLMAAIVTSDGKATVWDLRSGDVRQRLATKTFVRGVAFTPDSQSVITASRLSQPPLTMWNVITGKPIRSFKSQTRRITDTQVFDIAVSHDGRYALSGGSKVILWDVATGKELRQFKFDQPKLVFGVGFSKDDSLVYASAMLPEMTTSAWLTKNGTLQHTIRGSSPSIRDLSISPRETTLLSHDSKQNYLYANLEYTPPISLGAHPGPITQIEFAPDGRILVSINSNGAHALWDVVTGHQLKPLPLVEKKLTRVRFHPKENRLVYGDIDGFVGAIDLNDSRRLISIKAHHAAIKDLALSPDGQRALTICLEEKTAKFWDLGTGKLYRSIELEFAPRSVSFLPNNKAAVIASDKGMWRLDEHSEKLELITEERGTTGFAFSVSNNSCACTSGSMPPAAFQLQYWDLAQRKKIRSFAGHEFGISQCALSPDGAWLVSISFDRTIRFWEAGTGKQLPVIKLYDGIKSIRYSPNGDRIAIGTTRTQFTWHLAAHKAYESLAPKVDRAITILSEDPKHMASLELLGHWYAFRGVWTWSAELFEEIRHAGGKIPSLPLARAYWSLGRYDDAWREFQRAMERGEAPTYYLRICQQTMDYLRSIKHE